jgi:PhnB protein
MQSPTAYLQFDGRCADALAFYAATLGGKITMLNKYSEAPPNTGMPPVPPNWIMHSRLEWSGGGMAKVPFTQTFWSAGFGMLVDRFGVPWMVNVETPVRA